MLGCFNPNLGKTWTNLNVGLKNVISNFNPSSTFTFNCKILIAYLTQHLVLPYLTQFSVKTKQCWVVLTKNWVKYGQTQMLG